MSDVRRTRALAALVGLAGLVGGGVVALAGQAGAATAVEHAASTPNGWRVLASTKTITVSSLVAQSRQSAWALGRGFTLSEPQADFPAGLHWNGHRWTKVSFPKSVSTTGIGCAGASSATNVWAFYGTSSAGNNASMAGALRLEGGRWRVVKRFPAGIVTNCLVESPSEVWVFGDAHVAPGVGTWHLHGRTWTQVPTGSYALDAASAVSSDDVWGLGETGYLVPVVARWNGRAWVRNTQLTTALPKGAGIGAITATGPHDVWLKVYVSRGSTVSTLVLRWNGSRWLKVGSSDFGYYLPGAVRDGHGGWWADVIVNPLGRSYSRLLHAVRGRWFRVPVSIRGCRAGTVYQLAPVPSSTSVLGLQECPAKPVNVTNVLLNGPRL
jgi:hypothetical protein